MSDGNGGNGGGGISAAAVAAEGIGAPGSVGDVGAMGANGDDIFRSSQWNIYQPPSKAPEPTQSQKRRSRRSLFLTDEPFLSKKSILGG